MFIQVWGIGLQKRTKMIGNHVHIRSSYHFKQVGVHGKMTEMKSIVWMTNAFGCAFAYPSHRSVKFWNCLMADLCLLNLIFVSSFSLFIGCGYIFANVFPNMSKAQCIQVIQVYTGYEYRPATPCVFSHHSPHESTHNYAIVQNHPGRLNLDLLQQYKKEKPLVIGRCLRKCIVKCGDPTLLISFLSFFFTHPNLIKLICWSDMDMIFNHFFVFW